MAHCAFYVFLDDYTSHKLPQKLGLINLQKLTFFDIGIKCYTKRTCEIFVFDCKFENKQR